MLFPGLSFSSIQMLQRSLSELNLSFNRLSSVGPSIGLCSRLLMLDLSGNQLSALPKELADLVLLREIIISYNRSVFTDYFISHLPHF